MKDSWGALPSSQVGGVAAAISARTADFRDETMGKEPQPGEERKSAQERELVCIGWNLTYSTRLLRKPSGSPLRIRVGY